MERKNIIQCLVLLLIISLSLTAIYAVEAGANQHTDSSNDQNGIYLSGSIGNNSMGSASPIHYQNPANIPTVYL